MKKRLALYVFWEKDGVVRQYVLYYLKALQEVAQDIIFIANGALQDEGKQKLKELGVQIVQRENTGLDFAAWQAVILEKGKEIANNYDELILCNSSCYGPVRPFSLSFDKMAAKECDFWGMTLHDEVDHLLVPGDEDSHILEHLQSFFLVFRHSVLKSDAWLRWWRQMRRAESYKQVVGYGETKFTSYLSANGLQYACVTDCVRKKGFCKSIDPTIMAADIVLKYDCMPLVKRKLFSTSVSQLPAIAQSYTAANVFEYIRNHTQYPVEYIWEDLLATQKMSDIKDSLHLNYILPTEVTTFCHPHEKKTGDVALICYGYYPDLAEDMVRYISSVPEHAHIYIISSREDALAAYRQCMGQLDYKHVEYRLKPNRGRDVSALLVTAKDIVERHEYVCFVHDKKTTQLHPLLGREFMTHCMECCLHSRAYVQNLLNVLCSDVSCGMLVPPTINTTAISPFGVEMGGNAQVTLQLYKLIRLTCPFDAVPVAPFGTCFWAKREALLPMYRKDWQIDDFPDEPLPTDATISHGIERILPMAAQDVGFYSAWCSPDSYAARYMNDLAIKYRAYAKFNIASYGDTWLASLSRTEKNRRLLTRKLKRRRFWFKIQYCLSFGMCKKKLVKVKRIDERIAFLLLVN